MVVKICIKFSVCNLAGNKKEVLPAECTEMYSNHTPFCLLPILKLGHWSRLVIYANGRRGFIK